MSIKNHVATAAATTCAVGGESGVGGSGSGGGGGNDGVGGGGGPGRAAAEAHRLTMCRKRSFGPDLSDEASRTATREAGTELCSDLGIGAGVSFAIVDWCCIHISCSALPSISCSITTESFKPAFFACSATYLTCHESIGGGGGG